jgi:hypothetical protein
MSQTTLNLVAIAIFTLTVSTLLSPFLDISPFFPATATFGLMGLATVDRFAWSGQGGNLLVDWFAQRSEQHRSRVLHHEAGHFLVAYLLGISVTGYALTAWEAQRQGNLAAGGGVRFDDQRIQAQLEEGVIGSDIVERYCQVWMAGGAAEQLAFGDVEGGVDDVIKLRGLLNELKYSPQMLEQKERWAAFQAKQMIERNAAAYGALMTAMGDRQPVETCIEAIVEAAV